VREEKWEAKAEKEKGEEVAAHQQQRVLESLGLSNADVTGAGEKWEKKAEQEKAEERQDQASKEIANVLLSLGMTNEEAQQEFSHSAEHWEVKAVREVTDNKLYEAEQQEAENTAAAGGSAGAAEDKEKSTSEAAAASTNAGSSTTDASSTAAAAAGGASDKPAAAPVQRKSFLSWMFGSGKKA
jgi:hypothetical protein